MKPATEKKVKEIQARAKGLKASFIREVRAIDEKDATQEDKEIPRVSGIVIREGRWLIKVAKLFIERHNVELSEADKKTLASATKYFEEMFSDHGDEVSKNEFIFRMPANFILHLERMAAMVLKFDAELRAQIARIEAQDTSDDEEIQQEIDAEMVG